MCHAAAATSASADQQEGEPKLGFGERGDELKRRKMADGTPGDEESSGQGGKGGRGQEAQGGGGDGTLVLHVRSGDIFDNKVLPYYGQVRTACNRFPGFAAPLY